ncbi:Trafficking protein particle complex subunit 12 [Labeo rohita]|uniref:Trafficking protein particle complex subunit 12 n=1 Tax=Labeo rohita TaxID=84645 RepID=A0ABQ8M930_LABRO|nr:Trafficking protein particle complex subunit 12 [Labeo rohita]
MFLWHHLFYSENRGLQGLRTDVTGVDGQCILKFGVYFVVVDTTSPSTMSSTMVFIMMLLLETTPPPTPTPPPPPPPPEVEMLTKRENIDMCFSEPNQKHKHTHTQFHYPSSNMSYLPASPSSSLLYSAISISSRVLMSNSILYS